MKILVTGCDGQIGKTLINSGVKYGFKMVGYSKENLNITSKKIINDVFNLEKPDLVINAAAYTKVDNAEKEIEKAFDVNEKGTLFLSQVCTSFNIPFFHISTDYVFDGKLDKPYTETDNVNPLNVYGISKESGEKIIRKNIEQHIILRTSWVFSPEKNNFVSTMMRMAVEKDEISVVADQFGGPTSADGIAETLLTIAYKYKNKSKIIWGTYNFSGYPNISWYEFANEIFKTAFALKLIKKIPITKPIKSFDYPTLAKRPENSRLDCTKIYKNFEITEDDWKVRLIEYLNILR